MCIRDSKSPARRVGQIDNRGSHFYLALYWAEELAKQTDDPDLAASFAKYAEVHDNSHARVLGETLDRATGTFLDENKSPARKVGSIDNRGSHFYLALYWAQELARQDDDSELAAAFKGLAETLAENEQTINDELIAVQGHPVDLGGYYRPDAEKVSSVMRPSQTFNDALGALG